MAFRHRKFDIEISREVNSASLGWPEPGEASSEANLGLNRSYQDVRGASWSLVDEYLQLERGFLSRIEQSDDPEAEVQFIEDEGLFETAGLDIGVGAAVMALSAAGCVPFTSCNGAAFGGFHQEAYPLVAFFTKAPMVPLLIECASEASVGLHNSDYGCLVVYSNTLPAMIDFAQAIRRRSSEFRNVPRIPTRSRASPSQEDSPPRQGDLFGDR